MATDPSADHNSATAASGWRTDQAGKDWVWCSYGEQNGGRWSALKNDRRRTGASDREKDVRACLESDPRCE